MGERGIGYRRELAADLLRAPSSVDFVEVVAEGAWASSAATREIAAVAEIWPVVPHGVKLSLGTATGIDDSRAKKLGELARRVRAPAITEHVAMTSTPRRDIGHLTAIPRTRESIAVLRANVARARRHLPDVPFLLENIATTFEWPESAIAEPDFYAEVAEATGCDLLLDVANLYANAVNAGRDPAAVARAYPLNRVGMIHIAGGIFEQGFYFDTHADPVPEAVFEVLRVVLEAVPGAPIVLERDAAFDAGLAAFSAEVERAHALRPREPRLAASSTPRPLARPNMPIETFDLEGLAARQEALAGLLVDAAPPRGPLAEAIGEGPLHRTRTLLKRKRVDDALPLLPSLGSAAGVAAVAAEVTASIPRSPRRQGLVDAWSIAEAALAHPPLADAARRDRLLLRASFSFPDAAARDRGQYPKPRRMPFVGFEELGSGVTVWAIKGFGPKVFLHERRPAKLAIDEPRALRSKGDVSTT